MEAQPTFGRQKAVINFSKSVGGGQGPRMVPVGAQGVRRCCRRGEHQACSGRGGWNGAATGLSASGSSVGAGAHCARMLWLWPKGALRVLANRFQHSCTFLSRRNEHYASYGHHGLDHCDEKPFAHPVQQPLARP